jgi:cardiolipin synthase
MLRVVLLPAILWCILQERFNWALWMVGAAGISDFLDGYLARRWKQRTRFGMFLDPIADKVLLSSCYLTLAMTEQIPWWVTGPVLARDAAIIITVVVLVLTTTMRQFPPSFIGKLNTAVQLLAIYVVLLDIVYRGWFLHYSRNVLMFLTPAMVIASSGQYAWRMIRKLSGERKPLDVLDEDDRPK